MITKQDGSWTSGLGLSRESGRRRHGGVDL